MPEPRPSLRTVSPGEIITIELEARDWSQQDLARMMGRSLQSVGAIVDGTTPITPETALELAKAFGTSAEIWTNLAAHLSPSTTLSP